MWYHGVNITPLKLNLKFTIEKKVKLKVAQMEIVNKSL